jgi:hypothetical protein
MDSHKEPVKVLKTREAFRLDYPSRKKVRGPGAAERRDQAVLVLNGTLGSGVSLQTISIPGVFRGSAMRSESPLPHRNTAAVSVGR